MKKPCKDCRPITGAMARASALLMRRFSILALSPCAARLGFMTRNKASGRAKIAIASVMKLKPDCKSISPMVKRGMLNSAPSPTVDIISPNMVIKSAFDTCPDPAKAAIAPRPTTISAKYSAEWNNRATEDRAGAKIISKMAPSVPPAKEAMAAIVNALPAIPARAIG